MEYVEFKKIVTDEAKSLGLSDYELYYRTSESANVSAFKHEIKEFSSSLEGGVCFRCIVDGRMGYASAEELSEESARSLPRRARENAAVIETDEEEFLCDGTGEYSVPETRDGEMPEADKLIAASLAGQDALYAADPCVIDGSETQVVTFRDSVAISNSRGLDLSYENTASLAVSVAVVSDGKEMSDGFRVKGGAFEDLDVARLADEAVKEAKAKLVYEAAPTGSYPVVFSPSAFADLLGTYSSIFSAEAARKDLSRFKDAEGTVVASDVVTVVDDPFYKESLMPIGFDAEGSPAYTKNVIEAGVLKTLLYNLKSAAVLGKKTTGNASKSSYDSPVGVSPFTMYVAPGTLTADELLARASEGGGNAVYVDSLGGLHAGANQISGDFSLMSAGFMIEDGKKTRAVKSFTVAGNFYDLLKQIAAVANDIEIRSFGGITSFASPSVLVEGLTVAGK